MQDDRVSKISFLTGKRAFTLIELLIVIAIILILIAIALPNFLEAQIRARVTKARGEMRTIGIALESYRLDWKAYPSYGFPNYRVQRHALNGMTWLTSPVAYITSIPEDPFPGDYDLEGREIDGPPFTYTFDGPELPYSSWLAHPHQVLNPKLAAYALYSLGPDHPNPEVRVDHDSTPFCNGSGCTGTISSYSPTNGTKSKGDIFVYGGEGRWMGLDLSRYRYTADPAAQKDPSTFAGQVVDGVRYLKQAPPHLSFY